MKLFFNKNKNFNLIKIFGKYKNIIFLNFIIIFKEI